MALYASPVIFQEHRRHGPAMTARTLARTLAMQLELPYEAGQRSEKSHSGGDSQSVAVPQIPQGIEPPPFAHRSIPVLIPSRSTRPRGNYL